MNNSRNVPEEERSKKRRFRMVIWFLAPLILLIIGAVIAAVTIPLVLAQKKATTPIPSTSTKSTTIITPPPPIATTAATTTTTIIATTPTPPPTTTTTTTTTTITTPATTITTTTTTAPTTTAPITTTTITTTTPPPTTPTPTPTTTPPPTTTTITTTTTPSPPPPTTTTTTTPTTTTITITTTPTTTTTTTTITTTPPPTTTTIATTTTTTTTTTPPPPTTTTTTTTTTATEINCVFPFAQSPSGDCVNILIDFNNCGIIGYVCPANYTSCSAGQCSNAPTVQLNNSIPIFTAALNGSIDDRFYNVTVPFSITLYNTTTNFVQVTTNGVLCLGKCSDRYTETALPTAAFPGPTALPYWDDLYIYANTSQGIYYQSEGNVPNRTLIFEYYCSHYQEPNEYYHFQVVFFEDMPGIVQYIYYDVSDRGANCTVGVQNSNMGPFMQHSFDKVNSVTQNMVLTFDTNAGIYTNSSIM